MKVVTRVLILLIRGYQLTFSSVMAPNCRYLPTCSAYAQEALARHGPLRGSWLAVRRVARCHPWGGMGIDPVPERARGPLAGARDLSEEGTRRPAGAR